MLENLAKDIYKSLAPKKYSWLKIFKIFNLTDSQVNVILSLFNSE